MRQQFDTQDLLRLQVQEDWPDLPNLVLNPSGIGGAWGWVPTTPATLDVTASGLRLTVDTITAPTLNQARYRVDVPKVTATGQFLKGWTDFVTADSGMAIKIAAACIDEEGAETVGTWSAAQSTAGTATAPDLAVPVGTVAVELRVAAERLSGTPNSVTVNRKNLVQNPSFETNATGWSAVDGTGARTTGNGSAGTAHYRLTADGGSFFLQAQTAAGTAGIPVNPAKRYRVGAALWMTAGFPNDRAISVAIDWYNSAGTLLLTAPVSKYNQPKGAWVRVDGPVVAPPAAAAYARVKAYFSTTQGGGFFSGLIGLVDAVMLEEFDPADGPSAETYYDGDTTDVTGLTYSWDGTAHASTTTKAQDTAEDRATFSDAILVMGTAAEIAATSPTSDAPWIDVLGSSYEIKVERDELNLGTLTANIVDSTLDPAKNTLIRTGKRVRLQALVSGTWENLIVGTISNGQAKYELKDPRVPATKRARITLTATDDTTKIGSAKRPNGVGTVAELRAALLGTGVPFNVNGATDAIDPASVVVVAVNENATALDQVAVTRDSVLGYAWLDRNGTMQVWDAANLSTTPAATLTESDYSDLDVDFDLARCINAVTIKHLRINPGTGETEEVTFGPYVDATSDRENGPRPAEFTVQGVDEADIPVRADAILAANATPVVRINSVTLPLRTLAEVEAHALRDLYDLILVSNAESGLDDSSRVTTVKHDITPERWAVELGFSTDGSVAQPQVTPSPVPGGGKTLAQLLRPVGEVTMWYGAKADCPTGWLVLDGTQFDAVAYPLLYDLLATDILPDLTDRFPVGAGTKALGTSGGSSTRTLVAANLPPHTHNMDHDHDIDTSDAVGTSGARVVRGDSTSSGTPPGPVQNFSGNTGSGPGTSTPVDILNPWRALWFIVRAA